MAVLSESETAYWHKKLSSYKADGYAAKPSLFAEFAQQFLPKTGRLLDLGGGTGQDSRYFTKLGYTVTLADVMDEPGENTGFTCEVVDMNESLPYDAGSFDVIFANLSLHYFTEERNEQLVKEIYEILSPGGVLAVLLNGTGDPEYGEGEQIESNYFQVGAIKKRFFDIESAKALFHDFETIKLDNNGSTYKDLDKGVSNLIRYIGVKK